MNDPSLRGYRIAGAVALVEPAFEARARRDAERAVVEQMLAASGASEEMRQRYLAAWDAAKVEGTK